MADILLLAAHPDLALSSVTHSMLDAVRAARLPGVEAVDLYRRYPDYAIDVEAEQRALAQAKLLVLLHPLHWYGMPGLQKLWLDEVLRFGWAYGPGGTALAGKDLWLVTSAGGTAQSYSGEGHNRHPLSRYLLPYEQTALHCGMRWLPPLVLHGAHQVGDETIVSHARHFVEQLSSYPRWVHAAAPERLEVPVDERPALFSSLAE
ncbi:MAG: NAD(P)H-dependent oxidoreductase [Paucibacter sp.]|nr:NAD(P)H-dependent oxidoreductase [Roseateles sp.]